MLDLWSNDPLKLGGSRKARRAYRYLGPDVIHKENGLPINKHTAAPNWGQAFVKRTGVPQIGGGTRPNPRANSLVGAVAWETVSILLGFSTVFNTSLTGTFGIAQNMSLARLAAVDGSGSKSAQFPGLAVGKRHWCRRQPKVNKKWGNNFFSLKIATLT
ncbi:hypothetical protein EDB86DRAFT_2968971, partial [Lactarius hatsudake]